MSHVKARWLLLIHQLPPKPDYFRVKIWRRLQRLGAVAIKNSVYVLPWSDQSQEDFQWVVREVTEGGGEASVCAARFVDGLSDAQIEALFHAARAADYAQIAEEARTIAAELPVEDASSNDQATTLHAQVTRLRKRFAEVAALDFFDAPGREATAGLLQALEARVHTADTPRGRVLIDPKELRGRTWVTRRGIHVDRMASGWLIKRFIDAAARFKYVATRDYHPTAGELRFDMFEGDFTHEGDHCTFEVLLTRCGITDPALRPIAEIVHDIDLKDGKFGRAETTGIDKLIAGIAVAHKEDEDRLERARAVFDDLYEYYRRKRA